jgi:hypothetical protein
MAVHLSSGMTARVNASDGAAPTDQLTDFVDRLGHADFAAREEAGRRLLEAGVEAIPRLVDAALATSPEAATRALHVLEEHLRSSDSARFEPADDALEQLAESDRTSVALEAEEILSRYRVLREQRAIAALRALGGGVRFEPLAEAQMLAAVLPDLHIQERGPYLGISSNVTFDTGPCVVGEVQPDGPAKQAGLQSQDIISAVNGREVQGFEDLIEKLKDHAVGERVAMTVHRRNPRTEKAERLTLDVQLGKWELPEYTDDALNYLKERRRQGFEGDLSPDEGPRDSAPNGLGPSLER